MRAGPSSSTIVVTMAASLSRAMLGVAARRTGMVLGGRLRNQQIVSPPTRRADMTASAVQSNEHRAASCSVPRHAPSAKPAAVQEGPFGNVVPTDDRRPELLVAAVDLL